MICPNSIITYFQGATRSDNCAEILYARQKLVLMAKAYNLQAIDMVYIKYKGTWTCVHKALNA